MHACVRARACCQCLVAVWSRREIKQSVNYLERAPVAVTERRRLNIQDQMLCSARHIMRQPHQAQTTHVKWSNTGRGLVAAPKLCHDLSKEHGFHHRPCSSTYSLLHYSETSSWSSVCACVTSRLYRSSFHLLCL